jgi:sphingomyelin phosphodiesterase
MSTTYNFAHISDTHTDFRYEEGANADCDLPMCCRATDGTPASDSAKAGRWGNYRCDLPNHTFQAALNDLKTHDFDFIVWTGDQAPHDIWNWTESEVLDYITQNSLEIAKVFEETDIPVYPTLGNHGCFPDNVINFSNADWITKVAASAWSAWLPPSSLEQIKAKGGAYSVRNEKHNLRVISLNTNACNTENWWLLANVTDPGGQITFLQSELEKAEAAGEQAFVMGHIAPCLSQCLSHWSYHYSTLLERF